MDVKNAKRAICMVGLEGGSVSVVSAEGEVIATEGLQPGRYRCSEWVPFMSAPGDSLQFEGQASPLVPNGGRVRAMKYGPGSHDTGANPDFVVTSADRFQRELDRKLKELSAKTDYLTKNINRANSIAKHTGQNVEVAKEEDTQVVDDDDTGGDTTTGDVRPSGDDSGTDFGSETVAPE